MAAVDSNLSTGQNHCITDFKIKYFYGTLNCMEQKNVERIIFLAQKRNYAPGKSQFAVNLF